MGVEVFLIIFSVFVGVGIKDYTNISRDIQHEEKVIIDNAQYKCHKTNELEGINR